MVGFGVCWFDLGYFWFVGLDLVRFGISVFCLSFCFVLFFPHSSSCIQDSSEGVERSYLQKRVS